jgi:hypothetical protein
MSKGVTAPLAVTAIVVGVSQGWLTSFWNWAYTTTHTGTPANPFSLSTNPAAPVTVGQGGDAVTGGLTGSPQVTITGTLNGTTFTPNNPTIPKFQVGPSSNEIPTNILSLVYKLFGTKPVSGGSNGVTVW